MRNPTRWIAVLMVVLSPLVIGSPRQNAAASVRQGLTGWYFDNDNFTALKLKRADPRIDFNWGTESPVRGIAPDTFSVRWQGDVAAPVTGTYTFSTAVAGGVRLWVDGRRLINRPQLQSSGEWSARVTLKAGPHALRVDYAKATGRGVVKLLWSGPGVKRQVVAPRHLSPTDGLRTPSAPSASPPPAPASPPSSGPTPSPPAPLPPGMQRWSDPATWGSAGLPKAGDMVTIPAGKTVVLDASTPPLKGLEVDGTLVFGDQDLTITSDYLMVMGKLQIGSQDQPFTKSARIELTGTDPTQNVMGMGAKVLGVMGGTLEIHGEQRDSWVHLGATATKGSTTVTLERNPGWRAGDRIAIASTDYGDEQDEEATVTAVSGSTLSLDHSLAYDHFGTIQTIGGKPVDERAEVALLSRNVKIEGEENSSADGFGGHMMVMDGGQAHIEGAELNRMGQKDTVRRYPLHFHMLGDAGQGSYLSQSSIHHSYNRCVTIHGTNGVRLQGNACYDAIGHGYFMEDGAERKNTLEGNLGFGIHAPAQGQGLLPSDSTPAAFWITNPDNTVTGNVAAGSDGFGFWYALPEHPTGLSGQQPSAQSIWPRRTPLGEFAQNVTHSNGIDGVQVDGGPKPDGTTEVTDYEPHSTPAPPAGGQPDSPSVEADFTGLTAYKNRGHGIWLRGGPERVDNAVLADNAIGATMASHDSVLSNSLVVGESANKGNPYPWDVGTGNVGADGRALPQPWAPTFPIHGFEFYDGRVGVDGTTFANYTPNLKREASALGFDALIYSFGLDPTNYARNLRFVAANRLYVTDPAPGEDGSSAVFVDADGSVTGAADAVVTAKNPFLADPSCLADPASLRADWNAYVCPAANYARLVVGSGDGDPAAIKPVKITRTADSKVQTLFGTFPTDTSATSAVLTNREYAVDYNGGTPQRLRFVLYRGKATWLLLSVPYSAPPEVTKYGCDLAAGGDSWCKGAASSLDDLRASTHSAYWWDPVGRRLYLKLVADGDWEPLEVAPSAG